MVVAPATAINRYSTKVGLLKPSRLIDNAAMAKNTTNTRSSLNRSPIQPPPTAPKIAPKLSTNRNARLEPRP
ncbi:hypothetical protein D3C77_659720 [compost metagenome]